MLKFKEMKKKYRSKSIEEKLLEKYTNINSLLEDSIQANNMIGVKVALKNGADIHTNDDYAVRYVCYNNSLELVKYLVENGANIHANNNQPIRLASERNYINIVEYLIEKGVNITNVIKETPNDSLLSHAINNENSYYVNMLLEYKIDIHCDDEYFLKKAYLKGNVDIIKSLIKYGADVDIVKDWIIDRSIDRTNIKLLNKPNYKKNRKLVYD